MSKHNLDLLIEAARLLKPLLGELVFVGGSTTALLVTDKAVAEVRPTYDVDAIAEISSYAAYTDFSERLRKCGFTEDADEGAPWSWDMAASSLNLFIAADTSLYCLPTMTASATQALMDWIPAFAFCTQVS